MSRAIDWAAVRRLLVVRLDNTGDVVMLAPALRGLRAAAPAMRLTLLASPAGARAATLVPDVDAVIEHRASWQQLGEAPDPAEELALIDRLHDERFDAAVIFTSFSQDPGPPALACYLAGIPVRAGWAPLFSGAVLSHPVEPGAVSDHQAERGVDLVRALGAAVESTAIRLRVPIPAGLAAEELLRDARLEPGRYVALLPGASAPARRYPAERFADAARELWRATGLRSLVIGSEREQALGDALLARAGDAAHSVMGATDVPTAAALVERAALVLANDSLGLHLADAFNVPVVAAWSGTDLESQWAPRFTASRLLRRPTDCSPCYAIDCPFDLECLDIPGAEVAAAALDLMSPAAPARVAGAAAGAGA